MKNEMKKEKCYHCGNEINFQYADSFEGEFYCKDCFEELFFHCDDCGELKSRDELIEAENSSLCEDCYCNNYFTCEKCGDVFSSDDSYTDASGNSICPRCYSNHYFTCSDCGEVFNQNVAIYSRNGDLCEDCYCNNYFTCDYCGEVYPIDTLSSCEDETLCDECFDDSSHVIHSYSHKPNWIIHRENRKERLYGIENEIECERNMKTDMAEWITRNFHHESVFLKEDSTIDYGFEIVSHPMTIKRHKEFGWKEMLNYLSRNKCRSHKTDTCGLHIHASKSGLNEIDITKIVSFVNLNLNRFQILARRNGCSYATYKKIENGQDLKNCKYSESRYEVINLGNRNTIEFRMFRGTLKHSSLISCIELVDATIEFCKNGNIGIGFIFKNPNRSWNKFLDYIKKDKKRYAELIVYMEEMNERNKRINEIMIEENETDECVNG